MTDVASAPPPKRVALVSPAWPPGSIPNGILTYVANLRAGLAAAGITSSVIADQVLPQRPGDPAGVNAADVIHSKTFEPPLSVRAAWKARERVMGEATLARRLGYRVAEAVKAAHARNPVDLVEMEESFGAFRFVKDAIPRPLIVRLHGPWCAVAPALGHVGDGEYSGRMFAEGEALRGAQAVSSPSKFALDCVRRHYGLALADAVVVPNPIAPVPQERRWRRDASDGKTVLFVGRFDRLKGGDVVLQAFRRLAAEVAGVELAFVGPDHGLRDDAGRLWSLGEYVAAHLPAELVPRVKRLGEQPPGVIDGLRRQAAVTIVASRFETFSMTTVEALAAGSPLVAPAAAAIAEIVRHGDNALAFAPGDAEDAARQLIALFRDPALADRLAGTAAEDARRYDPEAVARQMVAFYQRVCAPARR
jgi:glycosyltransferase involved in cell wall biosynthesis